MKLRTLLLIMTAVLLVSPVAFAQDDATGEGAQSFTLSGTVDTYLHTTFGTKNPYAGTYDGGENYVQAPSTAFANLKGFSLGMVNLIASYEGEKVGFVADLVFGPRGSDAVFASPMWSSTGQIINQLYVYWKPSDNFTLTLGNFNTFLGYEVISPAVNFHYSTSYMFSWGPFSHTGIKGNLEFGDGMNLMLAVMNPTDLTEFNPLNTYTIGAQLGKTGDAGGIYLNLLYGDQDGKLDADIDPNGTVSAGNLFQVDLTAGWDLSETFYLGVNATYNQTAVGEIVSGGNVEDLDGDAGSFMGVALYPKLKLSESTSIGLRAEYFSIKNDYIDLFTLDDGDGSVIDLTLSLNKTIGNLTLIPEIRLDKTSDDSFVTKDLDDTTDTLLSFNFAAIYKF
ncbi:MAG TPA: outer membrane beta-barrel protein [Cyclobacteriaceae bacterium]